MDEMKKKGNVIALLPIGVFLVLYLGLGILFEYVMKIPMGFYNVPIVFAFLVAILVACLQNQKVSFEEKLGIMAQGLAAAFLVRDQLSYLFSRLPNTGMFLISLAVPISAVANLLLCVGYFLILKRQDARKEKLT